MSVGLGRDEIRGLLDDLSAELTKRGARADVPPERETLVSRSGMVVRVCPVEREGGWPYLRRRAPEVVAAALPAMAEGRGGTVQLETFATT
jgi:hypothetical protein